jgi:hypothetical protein
MLIKMSALPAFFIATSAASARIHAIGSSVLPVPTEHHTFPEWAVMALFGLLLLGASAILRKRMRT